MWWLVLNVLDVVGFAKNWHRISIIYSEDFSSLVYALVPLSFLSGFFFVYRPALGIVQ